MRLAPGGDIYLTHNYLEVRQFRRLPLELRYIAKRKSKFVGISGKYKCKPCESINTSITWYLLIAPAVSVGASIYLWWHMISSHLWLWYSSTLNLNLVSKMDLLVLPTNSSKPCLVNFYITQCKKSGRISVQFLYDRICGVDFVFDQSKPAVWQIGFISSLWYGTGAIVN